MHKKLISIFLFVPFAVLYLGILWMQGVLQVGTSTGWVIFFLVGSWWLSMWKNIQYHMYFWQRFEYRIDRFGDFLTTTSGRRFLFNRSTLFFSLLIVQVLITIAQPQTPVVNFFLPLAGSLLFLMGYQLCDISFALIKKTFSTPTYTMSSLFLMGSYALVELVIVVAFPLFGLVFVEMGRGILIAISIFIMKLLAFPFKKFLFLKAQKAREKLGFHHVVGIVGAYGKTTVKEFLAHVLAGKFTILSTPKRVNTDRGIARLLLHMTYTGQEIFLVEMGGYKKGEVATIAKMVQPTIGILTGVGNQHAALYGSEAAVLEGDFELMTALPKHGLAFLPRWYTYPDALLGRISALREWIDETDPVQIIAWTQNESGSTVTFSYLGKSYVASIPLWGKHQSKNLLIVFRVALALGMTMDEIVKRLDTLVLPEGSLMLKKGMKDILFIDDTYNGNVHGIHAGLELLKELPGKRKYMITQGVLELGKLHAEEHMKIGAWCATGVDGVVVIREDAVDPIASGVAGRTEVFVCLTYKDILNWCTTHLQPGDVVYLANRLPGNLKEILLTQK